jgi:hypothetical protein
VNAVLDAAGIASLLVCTGAIVRAAWRAVDFFEGIVDRLDDHETRLRKCEAVR